MTDPASHPDEVAFLERVMRYHDRTLTAEEIAALERDMKASARLRALFAEAALRSQAIHEQLRHEAYRPAPMPKPNRWHQWYPHLAAAAAVLVIGLTSFGLYSISSGRREIVARFGSLQECRWVNAQTTVAEGDGLVRGQRVELSSGRVELLFGSGAVSTLLGPCIFEVESAKGGFLTLGQMKTRAATPQSKGFTVHTRTARIVDVGTEFVISAAADGLSRVDVTSGEVIVHPNGLKRPQHLHQGDALSVEAGSAQVIVRIESGDGTPAFRFPTIEPPSHDDAADISRGIATVRVVQGELSRSSGGVTKLLDGKGQPSADAPSESLFFADNTAGMVLLDLGRSMSVTKINTFSWHRNSENVRATQKFSLYGFNGNEPPAFEQPLASHGWVLIGRVNTDDYFNVGVPRSRPEQQASSITGARGVIGRYRYLLWDVQPTLVNSGVAADNTFYGEFDVYAQ